MFARISVVGEGKHPLYDALIRACPQATSTSGGAMRDRLAGFGIATLPELEILWNFEKFVIGRSGEVVARFAPDTAPEDPALVAVIERELARAA